MYGKKKNVYTTTNTQMCIKGKNVFQILHFLSATSPSIHFAFISHSFMIILLLSSQWNHSTADPVFTVYAASVSSV